MAARANDGRIPLNGGFYKAPSLIANAQRCVNLYPEMNPKDAPAPFTHYLTPGLVEIFQPSIGEVRGMYRATNGGLFAVIGNTVYFVDMTGIILYGWFEMGKIATHTGPVKMSDNGSIVVLVDGSAAGYWWNLLAFSLVNTIVDAAFYGANYVAFLDGFFIFNRPATNQFYISPSFWDGAVPFDPLDIASKIGGNDQIIGLAVIHREIWLIGQLTTEVWYNSGGTDFPFDRLPGVFLDHGMIRGYSLAQADVSLFWLQRDVQGQCMIFQGLEYAGARISTHAIEKEIQSYTDIIDAYGFCYQQLGHTFYVLNFPKADRTWVYDMATKLWHERAWMDDDGVEHRIRPSYALNAYNQIVAGDFENGKIYTWEIDVFTDAGDPIMRRRGFPHVISSGKMVSYDSFIADMEVGTGGDGADPPKLLLRWSDTRGASWGNTVEITWGATGDYLSQPMIRDLGMAKDRVFEIFWSFPYKTALQGPWITATPAEV